MAPPLLKLAFVKGPRDGDSLQYKPGSTIRIGRIVRGNDIAIKDAGISTKHLRIVSDSDGWLVEDLGSSNGTMLNSENLDPDSLVNLRHGDVIKLGECTSIVVNFEIEIENVPPEEHKLPPRPRRNNRRTAVSDPDPDPDPNLKQTGNGRSSKQEEKLEQPKRSRATRSRAIEDGEEEAEVADEKVVVKRRVGRPRKNEKEVEEVAVEKKVIRRGKNTASIDNSGLNPIKLEVEDTPKVPEIPAMKRATRSKKKIENVCLGNVKSEVVGLEERTSRASTRSKRNEVGGDVAFMDLDMVLNQARKSRAKKKKKEEIPSEKVEIEPRNDDKDNVAQEGCSDKEDETSKIVKQEVEIESTIRDKDRNCSVREDKETENLQETNESLHVSEEAGGTDRSDGICDEEKAEESIELNNSTIGETEDLQDTIVEERDDKSNKKVVETKVEVDLAKMTLGEWFDHMEVQLRKQIVEETEKMIEPMRSKAQRLNKYIAEQKQAKGT